MKYGRQYFDRIGEMLQALWEREQMQIEAAAARIVETSLRGGDVYIFGCTHAGILAAEAFYRTGGLAIINPLFPPGLTCDVTPITLTTAMERIDGYGAMIVREAGMKGGDLLILHSVSGRNAVPVDMAIAARERGVYVIVITNMAYSARSAPRGKSGLRLFEAGDLVIDDGGEFGDACVVVEGFPQQVAPTSTVTGAAIVNAITAEAAGLFVEKGVEPPVFMSANIDGGDAYNQKILAKYKDHIHYMG